VRDLGGVEEPGSVGAGDGAEQHAVRCAGDEIADVLVAGERGHGVAIGGSGIFGGIVPPFAAFGGGFERAGVGAAAEGDGWVVGSGAGVVRWFLGCFGCVHDCLEEVIQGGLG